MHHLPVISPLCNSISDSNVTNNDCVGDLCLTVQDPDVDPYAFTYQM